MSRHVYDPADATLADLAPINVTIDEETGLATLSGVHYQFLRHILTLASIYEHDHPHTTVEVDPEYCLADVVRANAEDDRWWHWVTRDVLDYCADRMGFAISPKYHAPTHGIDTRREHSRRSEYEPPAWRNKSDPVLGDWQGPLSPACIERRNERARQLIDQIKREVRNA